MLSVAVKVVFNSIQIICIAHFHKLQICLRGLYNLYTSTSPTFDLTSDQEKLPTNPSRGKKGRNLQESNRGGSLSKMERTIDVM